MMIKTAGGPGLVHPIDFNERKQPRFSRTTWIAGGVVLALHAGLGTALYYQRFELPAPLERPQPPVIDVITFTLPKPPQPVMAAEVPPAPTPRVNDTPLPTTPTDTLPVIRSEDPPGDTTVLTFNTPVELPQPDSTAREPVVTPPRVITNPSWERQPSGDQMMRAYPPRAEAAGVSGSASLNCLVLPTGAVTDCAVTRETPGGYGFGRAAQGLSRYFRINPRTVDGAAEGSRVAIALRFTLPDD